MLRLPEGKERYDCYNLCSSICANLASVLLFTTLGITSMLPIFISIPMICLSSTVVLVSLINLFNKVHLASKPKKTVTWADQINIYYEAPREIFVSSL